MLKILFSQYEFEFYNTTIIPLFYCYNACKVQVKKNLQKAYKHLNPIKYKYEVRKTGKFMHVICL